jgi:hypothetical protein
MARVILGQVGAVKDKIRWHVFKFADINHAMALPRPTTLPELPHFQNMKVVNWTNQPIQGIAHELIEITDI